MTGFDNVPAYSIPKAKEPKIGHHQNPGPGKYLVARELNHGVTIASTGRNDAVIGAKADN